MSRLTIRYGDVAAGAKESFVPTTSQTQFNTLWQLNQYNLVFDNYGNPCDNYSVALDGKTLPLPSDVENENVGFWSNEVTNEDGTFGNPIILTLTSSGEFSSKGLSLRFDDDNNIYAKHLNIKWYNISGQLIDTNDFFPNSPVFFCERQENKYSKIVITFYSLNMPFSRLRLRSIEYGEGIVFVAENVRSGRVSQTIDPISTDLSINSSRLVLDLKSTKAVKRFENNQPFVIEFNDKLLGTTFIKSAERKSEYLWDIQTEDYIGLLDNVKFEGGMYVNKDATELADEIFSKAKVPYTISESFAGEKVTGYIPFTTCREALKQLAFAIQAVVDTTIDETVHLRQLSDTVSQTIPLSRIKEGQSITDEEMVSEVSIMAHTYSDGNETTELYKASESGTGLNIFVKFNEAMHGLEIVNGEIIESGTNYCIINANDGCVVTGKNYIDTQTRFTQGTSDYKSVEISDATLVSVANVDKVLHKCYNWLVRTSAINLGIIEGKHEVEKKLSVYGIATYGVDIYGVDTYENSETSEQKVIAYDQSVSLGDKLKVATQYLGIKEGTLISQSYGLNGGIIIKDAIIK